MTLALSRRCTGTYDTVPPIVSQSMTEVRCLAVSWLHLVPTCSSATLGVSKHTDPLLAHV